MEKKLASNRKRHCCTYFGKLLAVKNPQLGENKACAAGERVII